MTFRIAPLAVVGLAALLTILAPLAAAQNQLTISVKEAGCPQGDLYCWDPAMATISPGQVTVTMRNPGTQPHNICVMSGTTTTCAPAGADANPNTATVAPGAQTTLTFTAPSSGNVMYWCNVSGHRDLGMEGNLTVQGTGTTPPPTPGNGTTQPPPRGSPGVGLVSIALGVGLLALVLRRRA